MKLRRQCELGDSHSHMLSAVNKPGRGRLIPAALATTYHIRVEGGEIRHVERPLVEQLAPTDPLRLGLVDSEPDVREAIELAKDADAKVVAARAHAPAS